MKICIYGAGATGGYLGVLLARAGQQVTLIARGPHLEAMRANGLTLQLDGERMVERITCTDDPAEAGSQDVVFLTLKAHSVPQVADQLAPLLQEQTMVITAQNGVPWWYFYRLEGEWENRRVRSVDPDGRLWDLIGPERAIGCVVYPSTEVIEPGVIRHRQGNRFMLGEPDGSKSERLAPLSRAMAEAGLKAPMRPRIRDDIWLKLWGNVSFNPVSVLTDATLEQMASDAGTHQIIRTMMEEARSVAHALGVRFKVDTDKRIQWAADVGAHKTSMLQDFERGRPLELDALVAAVAELGDVTGVDTPTIDTILALARLRAATALEK